MAQNLEDFLNKRSGASKDIRDIDSLISPSGDLTELEGIDVIVRSLTNLFLIPKETYVMDPEFGASLYKYIFEPVDIVTKNRIEQDVMNAVRKYEDRADIDFDVLFFKNKKGFMINLKVTYKGTKKEVSVTVDETLLKTLP